MLPDTRQFAARDPAIAFHLLSGVGFDDAWELQQRLVSAAASDATPRIVVLFCEHSAVITVGRHGSLGHIGYSSEQLRRAGLAVRWIGRGGGCLLHAPGQLAVYPLVPLDVLGWSIKDYLQRLQTGVVNAFAELQVRGVTQPERFGVWGRSGLLAAFGIAVRHGITCHGAFINVNPDMRHFPHINTVAADPARPEQKSTMGCLLAERSRAVRMSGVRSALIESLAAAFGSERYHLYTGHPLLRKKSIAREASACDT